MFLVGERAYKLKKPIVLPFLDYGTPARRRRMCQQEVRLNRRLAPDLYLGVRALVPSSAEGVELADEEAAGAIDYVVEMCRYDERRTVAALLESGELERAQVAAVGRLLASFHAGSRRVPRPDNAIHAAQREIDVNSSELLALAEMRSERERLLGLWRFANAFISARREWFETRAEQGRIRDCHGDLRAEHVLVTEPPAVVDCVEFDLRLRAVDVADDLAFLVMDLFAGGGERFAQELIAAYRDAGGDPGEDPLLAFYASYRALVRAKVLLVRAAQLPPASAAHGHASAQARDLLALAERFGWRARLPLAIVVCGVPASGKSHLADALTLASGLTHIGSDETRKRLAGIEPTERAAPEHYAAEFSKATYEELGRRAALEVRRRGGVVIDATFRHRGDRDSFSRTFERAAPLMFVECRAPVDVLARRAVRRDRSRSRISDATLQVVLHERASWEALDEVAPEAHLIVRTDRPAEAVIADVVALLDARMRS